MAVAAHCRRHVRAFRTDVGNRERRNWRDARQCPGWWFRRPRAKQGDACAPVYLAFPGIRPVELPVRLAVRPRLAECRHYGRCGRAEAAGEGGEGAGSASANHSGGSSAQPVRTVAAKRSVRDRALASEGIAVSIRATVKASARDRRCRAVIAIAIRRADRHVPAVVCKVASARRRRVVH